MEKLPEDWVTEIAPSGNIYTYNKAYFDKYICGIDPYEKENIRKDSYSFIIINLKTGEITEDESK